MSVIAREVLTLNYPWTYTST